MKTINKLNKVFLGILILVIISSGCVTIERSGVPSSEIPLNDTFVSLCNERNVVNQNDCSNKCGRYVRELRSHGYEADIVVVERNRSMGSELHAVVKVGDNLFLDPVWGESTHKLSDIGSFRFVIPSRKLNSLGSEFK